ncbi:hypothetical protein [Pontibacillus litoralis]|uniref:Uncharacterized protein n=1 Tax=Pontibacillus litoralis JSM 072002 TaxID=1385512 RepID=A0A0A5GB07_9BACI|nr:hypothetical protein [Pontibacillus litoralis]KGX89219.1 hypothetical protein N784_02305 [Pontibacillus litoralis JSM 072002]
MGIKYDEKEIVNIFMKGDSLLTQQKYEQTIEKFLKVIELSENTNFSYLSGAYTNLAKATWEPDPLDLEKTEEALGYIKTALQLKPSNQAARSLAIPILVFMKDFSSAIKYFLELTSKEAINHSITYLNMMETLAIKGDPSIKQAVPAIEELYQSYKAIA